MIYEPFTGRNTPLRKKRGSASRKMGDYTFADAASVYRAFLHAEGRLRKDTELRIRILEKQFNKYKLVDITPMVVLSWISNHWRTRSVHTINRNMAVLTAMLNCAKGQGMLAEVPRFRRRKTRAHPGTRTVVLELKEIEPVIARIESKHSPLAAACILFLCDTGFRFGEMMNVRWKDIAKDWIRVRSSDYEHSKTKERRVPTSPRLMAYMVKHNIVPAAGEKPEDKVFEPRWALPSAVVGRELNAALKEACAHLSVADGAKTRVHDMRHTFAYQCAMAGADLADIRDMLGHENIAMTLRYRGFVKSRAEDVIRRGMTTFLGEEKGDGN